MFCCFTCMALCVDSWELNFNLCQLWKPECFHFFMRSSIVILLLAIIFGKSLHLFISAKLGHTYFSFCTVALFLLNDDSFIVKTMITSFRCYNCILLKPCSSIIVNYDYKIIQKYSCQQEAIVITFTFVYTCTIFILNCNLFILDNTCN